MGKSKKIVVDCKLLAQTGSGISVFFKPLLRRLLKQFPDSHFYLAAPSTFNVDFLAGSSNYSLELCPWPSSLPQKLAKIIYHFVAYPAFLAKLNADFLVAGYYDFRIPNFYRKKSIHFVYDLCFWKVPECYSWFSRVFHQWMFWLNREKSQAIFTISESSRNDILHHYPKLKTPVELVYCSFESDWNSMDFQAAFVDSLTKKLNLSNRQIFLYTGGLDPRKNLERLLMGFARFLQQNPQSLNSTLVITGKHQENDALSKIIDDNKLCEHVVITGFLSKEELGCLYKNLAHAVLTVSLYEGFGLTTLEAKSLGLPLLCSDIPVFREVMGDYPLYCDPYDLESIAAGIKKLSEQKRLPVPTQQDPRFLPGKSEERFVELMKDYL